VLEVLKETQLDGAAPPSVTDPSESQTF
jgi:hypothetical protein